MSNYLKKLLFSGLILMMPYMNSGSKAMDAEDYDGSTVRARKVSFVTEDYRNASSSITQSTSSQIESLEDSQTSWASYLMSPFRATMQIANEFVTIATNHPKLAMSIGLFYVIPAVSAACNCVCYDHGRRVVLGRMNDGGVCAQGCVLHGMHYGGCN